MADISNLRICKQCKNVYSLAVSGSRTTPTPCPVCKSTNGEHVTVDV